MSAVPVLDPDDAPVCPHARVDANPPKMLRGSSDGARDSGWHVAQGGICNGCGRPVLRLADPAWSRWAAPAEEPQRRRQGHRAPRF